MIMKRIYLYLVLLAGVSYKTHAQDIYNGGIADGFSYAKAGFNLYAGGGQDGFAYATYTAAPLPLTLLSFTAMPAGNTIRLKWQTTNEISVDHFETERSADAVSFQYLASVAADGNGSSLKQDYQSTDSSPLAGMNYYRLKEVDTDGRYKYSGIVAVNFTGPVATLALYPNPAGQTLHIRTSGPANTQALLSIYTADGRLAASQPVRFTAGTSNFSVNVASLGPGLYFCKIEGMNRPVISFIKN